MFDAGPPPPRLVDCRCCLRRRRRPSRRCRRCAAAAAAIANAVAAVDAAMRPPQPPQMPPPSRPVGVMGPSAVRRITDIPLSMPRRDLEKHYTPRFNCILWAVPLTTGNTVHPKRPWARSCQRHNSRCRYMSHSKNTKRVGTQSTVQLVAVMGMSHVCCNKKTKQQPPKEIYTRVVATQAREQNNNTNDDCPTTSNSSSPPGSTGQLWVGQRPMGQMVLTTGLQPCRWSDNLAWAALRARARDTDGLRTTDAHPHRLNGASMSKRWHAHPQ